MAAKRIKYSREVKEKMIEYYKENPEASLDSAREHIKGLGLGYETISKTMHDDILRKAAGPIKVPKQCVMDLKTGIFKRLESVTAGDRVAIFELKRRARIEMIDENE